jgi:prolyl-tRNA editing enzyme YbaK/EbsC (Cys-tRNA(Pro) deacylase)
VVRVHGVSPTPPDHDPDRPDLSEHATVQRVTAALRALQVPGDVVTLKEAAPTAAAAAAQLGCDVAAIANSLVFDAEGTAVLVLSSGGHRVDTRRLVDLLELPAPGKARKASPDFVRNHTGMAIGGVAPVGHPQPLRTVVDVDLARYEVVWAAAGHPHTVFPTSYSELLRITAGTPAEVS